MPNAPAKMLRRRRAAGAATVAEPILIDRRLLALPYRLELTREGRLVLTAEQEPALTFEQLATTHPILPDGLGWKVETNRRGQIIMSPPPFLKHQELDEEIRALLRRLLPRGKPMSGPGVCTSDGTKVPDVVWVSATRRKTNRSRASFSPAPEICIEILSPANSRREIERKKRLYFEAGALEFWRCGRQGEMAFFDPQGSLSQSRLCPKFPAKLNLNA